LQVSRLIRIRYGPIDLPRNVRAGHFQDLQQDEIKALYATVKLDAPKPHVMRRPGKKRRRSR
jgi:23S rRNA pseudouridine2605 synthase